MQVFTLSMLAEYDAVLHRPRLRLRSAAVQSLLDDLHAFGLLIETAETEMPHPLPDPDD
jgi:hypothetical protein